MITLANLDNEFSRNGKIVSRMKSNNIPLSVIAEIMEKTEEEILNIISNYHP